METLRALLNAYIENSLLLDEYAEQFIEYWNEIRIEQHKAIDQSGIRETLDQLWNAYKAGNIDEVTYGMRWTDSLSKLKNIRIMPQSIVYTIGNALYNQLILYKETEHLDTEEIPTDADIREQSALLLTAIED